MAVARSREAAWIVVVGASAGGVDALRRFVTHLPSHLGAAVAVVLHVAPNARSLLPEILGRSCHLPVAHATSEMVVEPDTVTVGPPGVHLAVAGRRYELCGGAAENGVRPAVDVLFRTASAAFGPRCIGVVLSGTRDDGAAGLHAISIAGGPALVQDPHDAAYPSMPEAAIARTGVVDLIASPEELARRLPGLIGDVAAMTAHDAADRAPVAHRSDPATRTMPTRFSCPDCGGPLEEPGRPGQPDFRCHVGPAIGDIAAAWHATAGRRLRVEHWGDAVAHGQVAAVTLAGGESEWREPPGFWSTIAGNTVKHVAWGDGHDAVEVRRSASGMTVWYGRDGVVVGVLTHEHDDDNAVAATALAERWPFPPRLGR